MFKNKNKNFGYHALAAATASIWGTTFVSTKTLINNGLAPTEIFLYRFVLAYVCVLLVSHKKLWCNSLKDEFHMLLAGLSGGSLYFIAENTALGMTFASNVSLLICTTPVFTALLMHFFYKEPLRKNMLYGSCVALVGVGLIVYNGSVVFKINPLGDCLTLLAALLWAIYCLILKRLNGLYDTFFITRKVFFYGIASLLFYFIFFPIDLNPSLLSQPTVYLNLLFLGIMASMLCYVTWNIAVKALGASETANYIYINPLVTLIASAIFLSETLTFYSLIGTISIIGGVYLAERKDKRKRIKRK